MRDQRAIWNLAMRGLCLPNSNFLFYFIALLAISYSAYLAFAFANQPPLDVHAFRQTQTAMTAYWFVRDGFKLAYETPVAGAPWSIPFEFPIYQLLVAKISGIFGVSLDASGRLTSYLFLILCLLPAKSITKKLQLPVPVFYIFAALLFSSPVYVYWGRTFMIETAALFFAVAAIKYFVDALVEGLSLKAISFFVIFITLSILQKSTTGLPVLGVLSIVFLYSESRRAGSLRAFLFGRGSLVALLCFAIPLAIGVLWVYYTDQVKSLNPLGAQLTSSALSKWNWGTLSQKISADLFVKVVWERIFMTNAGGALGLFLLLMPFFPSVWLRLKIIVLTSVALGVLPLFLFTNLHIVHDYYQSANIIFILYAVAISLGGVLGPALGTTATLLALVLILVSNYMALLGGYMPSIKQVFNKENRDLAIGWILKRELPDGGQFVAFGNDWSSTFAYISQRKSFTAPGWFNKYEEVKSNPESFVEKGHLGAVVSCSVKSPNLADLILWSSDERSWKIGETHGCLIATPQKEFKENSPKLVQCQGSIDRAEVEDRDGVKIISFAGWTTLAGVKIETPENIYLMVSRQGVNPIYYEALKVPRLDVNAHLGVSSQNDAGFSRIVPVNLAPGEYDVGVVQSKGDQHEVCQFNKKLLVRN